MPMRTVLLKSNKVLTFGKLSFLVLKLTNKTLIRERERERERENYLGS